jgi:hypothetical protein
MAKEKDKTPNVCFRCKRDAVWITSGKWPDQTWRVAHAGKAGGCRLLIVPRLAIATEEEQREANKSFFTDLPAFFTEYRRLGGRKLDKDAYARAFAMFLAITLPSHVFGEGHREHAWKAWSSWLHKHHRGESPGRFFESVDNVQPYT